MLFRSENALRDPARDTLIGRLLDFFLRPAFAQSEGSGMYAKVWNGTIELQLADRVVPLPRIVNVEEYLDILYGMATHYGNAVYGSLLGLPADYVAGDLESHPAYAVYRKDIQRIIDLELLLHREGGEETDRTRGDTDDQGTAWPHEP